MGKNTKYLIISSVVVLIYLVWFYNLMVDLSEVGFVNGFLLPTLCTFLLVNVTPAILDRFVKSDYEHLIVQGYLKGLIFFVLIAITLTFIAAIISPILWPIIVDLVHLPGTLVTRTVMYSILHYLNSGRLIVEAREPIIAWTQTSVSLIVWGGISAIISFLKAKKKR
jgi:hypothetical protein